MVPPAKKLKLDMLLCWEEIESSFDIINTNVVLTNNFIAHGI